MTGTKRPVILALALMAAPAFAAESTRAEGGNIRIEFDDVLHSRVVALFDGKERVMGGFMPSESIRVSGQDVADFAVSEAGAQVHP